MRSTHRPMRLQWSSPGAVEQLPLFRRLPIPRGAVPWRRRRFVAPARATHGHAFEQLAFAFRLRELDRDDQETPYDRPVHAVVSAAAADPLVATGPRSVFDLPGRWSPGMSGLAGHGAAPQRAPIVRTVVVGSGVTRTVGASYPVRMTQEDEERERRRRAKQRPPRPTRKAKTRSRKLLDLIGADDAED